MDLANDYRHRLVLFAELYIVRETHILNVHCKGLSREGAWGHDTPPPPTKTTQEYSSAEGAFNVPAPISDLKTKTKLQNLSLSRGEGGLVRHFQARVPLLAPARES